MVACISFSCTTSWAISFNLLMVISGAAMSLLIIINWIGTYFLKNYSLDEYHSINRSIVCLVFSIWAFFINAEALADMDMLYFNDYLK